MALPSADVRRASVAGLLVILGLLLCGLYRILSGTENFAFSSGSLPPQTARVTAGTQYLISVRGGVDAILARGGLLTSPQCEWSTSDSSAQALTVTAYDTNTKAINTVGTFIAPVTGDIHIACAGWGPVFVDDADDAPSDVAGWMLFAGIVCLTVGVGLAISAMRAGSDARASERAAREHDQVEGRVDVAAADGEVAGTDAGHVGR